MSRLAILTFLLAALPAQGTRADYQRADDNLRSWRRLYRPFDPEIHWLEGGALWFVRGRGAEREFVRVAANGAIRRGRSAAEIGVAPRVEKLAPQHRWHASSRAERAAQVTFENGLDRPVRLFWVDGDGVPRSYGTLEPGGHKVQATFVGHVWIADCGKDDVVGAFVVPKGGGLAVFDEASRAALRRAAEVRRSRQRLFVRDHDVWLRGPDGERRLTSDGSATDGYRVPRSVSPDQRYALGFRVEAGERHVVHLIESAPKDRLEPRLHELDYRKPGDRIDRVRPVLFDLVSGRNVAVDEAPFANAWSITRAHWAPDSSEVFVLFNQRGHQLLRVDAIEATTGRVRHVLEERSNTFVDYSQKTWMHWLADGSAFLWASERDGWNHLYMVDAKSGDLQQITRGRWLVRKVEHVDEQARRIWFTAYGIHPEQDPYHAHLASIAFDGRDLRILTSADGTHTWQFSPDRSRIVVRWSRVDHPWVTELRRASDGELLAELGRDDPSALLAAGFRPPERFVAKGRDGATDIHGILIVPSNFDPERRYPVIESIYAGPHGHFVPKRFGLGLRQRKLAELGFVVVQIDGMGTNWRSRAFHDVCWRNLKDSGFPDRILWLRDAARTRPWLDLERVGIFGGSAGGQSALAALLHHGDFYKVAVSDCGCHDNRMDKIWWNEAWMGWPVGPWYAVNSNVTHAAKLRGRLLLTVGELDRNVDPASTMQVVRALIDANRDFDLVVVPGGGHGVGETSYLVRRRQDFFVRHLLGVEPPSR